MQRIWKILMILKTNSKILMKSMPKKNREIIIIRQKLPSFYHVFLEYLALHAVSLKKPRAKPVVILKKDSYFFLITKTNDVKHQMFFVINDDVKINHHEIEFFLFTTLPLVIKTFWFQFVFKWYFWIWKLCILVFTFNCYLREYFLFSLEPYFCLLYDINLYINLYNLYLRLYLRVP